MNKQQKMTSEEKERCEAFFKEVGKQMEKSRKVEGLPDCCDNPDPEEIGSDIWCEYDDKDNPDEPTDVVHETQMKCQSCGRHIFHEGYASGKKKWIVGATDEEVAEEREKMKYANLSEKLARQLTDWKPVPVCLKIIDQGQIEPEMCYDHPDHNILEGCPDSIKEGDPCRQVFDSSPPSYATDVELAHHLAHNNNYSVKIQYLKNAVFIKITDRSAMFPNYSGLSIKKELFKDHDDCITKAGAFIICKAIELAEKNRAKGRKEDK